MRQRAPRPALPPRALVCSAGKRCMRCRRPPAAKRRGWGIACPWRGSSGAACRCPCALVPSAACRRPCATAYMTHTGEPRLTGFGGRAEQGEAHSGEECFHRSWRHKLSRGHLSRCRRRHVRLTALLARACPAASTASRATLAGYLRPLVALVAPAAGAAAAVQQLLERSGRKRWQRAAAGAGRRSSLAHAPRRSAGRCLAHAGRQLEQQLSATPGTGGFLAFWVAHASIPPPWRWRLAIRHRHRRIQQRQHGAAARRPRGPAALLTSLIMRRKALPQTRVDVAAAAPWAPSRCGNAGVQGTHRGEQPIPC